jgi:ferredoxin-NADP reductase
MSSHSTLTIRAHAPLAADTRLLELARADGADFGFRGGQYVIINTGLTLANGKLVKRAYSLLSPDHTQQVVRIAVKKLDGTLGSNFLHEVPNATELGFSGPWGKWCVDPIWNAKRLLVVVTDTAITAALGLACSKSTQGMQLDLLWLRTSRDYFLPDTFVSESLGARSELRTALIPAVGDTARVQTACALALEFSGAARYDAALCAGDGAVIYPLRNALVERGLLEQRVLLESFFNNPAKKSV